MSRTWIAVLLSAVVVTGSLSPASPAPSVNPAPSGSQPTTAVPLPPGSAAGIRQAQGQTGGILLGAAVTGGIFVAMLLLIEDNDTGPVTVTSTTGTN